MNKKPGKIKLSKETVKSLQVKTDVRTGWLPNISLACTVSVNACGGGHSRPTSPNVKC